MIYLKKKPEKKQVEVVFEFMKTGIKRCSSCIMQGKIMDSFARNCVTIERFV